MGLAAAVQIKITKGSLETLMLRFCSASTLLSASPDSVEILEAPEEFCGGVAEGTATVS